MAAQNEITALPDPEMVDAQKLTRTIRERSAVADVIIYAIVGLVALACIIPFWVVVIGSFTAEETIIRHGFGLWTTHWSKFAYEIIFAGGQIPRAYLVTLLVTAVGSFLSLLFTTALAYVAANRQLPWSRYISVYVLITVLFSGGMVPWYLVCTRLLHLSDTIWAMIVPYLVNPWYFFLVRNYLRTLPESLLESAYIDGASDLKILTKIILPLSKPVLAAVGLFIALMYWNDWWLSLMLVDKNDLQPLQLLLRRLISNITMAYQMMGNIPGAAQSPPAFGVRMATVVVTIGPIILLYPFVQKYFVSGLTVGSVKG